MPRFTLRQLELFAALPKHPTLSSAAAALHISESALSHALTELERSVGEQLCVRRKGRGLQLTPAGTFFAERAQSLVRDADELARELVASGGTLAGPVTIGCYHRFAESLLPPMFDEFAELHPKVRVALHVGAVDDLMSALFSGLLDIAIVYRMFLPEGLSARVIYESEVLAVLPASHPLSTTSTVDLEQLAAEPLLLLDSAPGAAYTRRLFAERNLEPRIDVAVPSVELVRTLVGRKRGYGLLMSEPNWTNMTSEGRPIITRPLSGGSSPSSVVAVWPSHLTLSGRAQESIAFLARHLTPRVRSGSGER